MSDPSFLTLGVYGTTEEAFFNALGEHQVDTLVDLRSHRGLRGGRYAYANSRRLQEQLASMNIRYLHEKDLAPTKVIRQIQKDADYQSQIQKRQRRELSPEFIGAYRNAILREFDWESFLQRLPENARVVALFCVERESEACHRSLVADELRGEFGFSIKDVKP